MDYNALAQQYGAISQPSSNQTGQVDYNALAKQSGSIDDMNQTPTQPDKGFFSSMGDMISKGYSNTADALGNFAEGGVKGAISTIASVPTNVSKVTSGIVGLQTQNDTNDTIHRMNSVADNIRQKLVATPTTDPHHAALLTALQQQMQTMSNYRDEMSGVQNEIDNAPMNTKPDILNAQGTAQGVGYGAEKLAEFMVPGGAINKVVNAEKVPAFFQAAEQVAPGLGEKILGVIGRTAASGVLNAASAGGITAAQGGDLNQILNAAKWGGIFGSGGQAVSEGLSSMGSMLESSAEKKASQALGATTKYNKQLTAKIVPEMLDRKVVYGTRAGLSVKAGAQMDEVGPQISEAFNNLPEDTKLAVAPIMKDMEDLKTDLVVKGTNQVPEAAQAKYSALQNIQKELISMANSPKEEQAATDITTHINNAEESLKGLGVNATGPVLEDAQQNIIQSLTKNGMTEQAQKVAAMDPSKFTNAQDFGNAVHETISGEPKISVQSLRSYRQILDQITASKKNGFGLNGDETAKLMAQKAMANSIRDTIASNYPDIAALNKEYNFWSNVKTVVDSTILRTKAQQTPLGQEIAQGAGEVAAATLKGKIGATIIGGVTLKFLKAAVTSPGWRNTSAVFRQTVADNIANGNIPKVIQLLSRIAPAAASGTVNPQTQGGGETQ